jgi:hypothetical protein
MPTPLAASLRLGSAVLRAHQVYTTKLAKEMARPKEMDGTKQGKKERNRKPDVRLELTALRLRVLRATDCASRACYG